jgi:hypothetical protein
MFINAQVGLLSPEKLANSAVLYPGPRHASGSAVGIIQSIGPAFDGLTGAAVSALSAGYLAGAKTSLTCRKCLIP